MKKPRKFRRASVSGARLKEKMLNANYYILMTLKTFLSMNVFTGTKVRTLTQKYKCSYILRPHASSLYSLRPACTSMNVFTGTKVRTLTRKYEYWRRQLVSRSSSVRMLKSTSKGTISAASVMLALRRQWLNQRCQCRLKGGCHALGVGIWDLMLLFLTKKNYRGNLQDWSLGVTWWGKGGGGVAED
jgi:hypothetical protein